MVKAATGESQAGGDVLGFEVGQLAERLLR